MAVMAREKWTDERLDDLTKRIDRGFEEGKVEIRDLRSDVHKGFDRVDADIRELRAEIGAVRSDMNTEIGTLRSDMNTEIGTLRSDTKKGFDGVDARFDAMQRTVESMQRTMLIGFVTLFVSITASVIGGILATQL